MFFNYILDSLISTYGSHSTWDWIHCEFLVKHSCVLQLSMAHLLCFKILNSVYVFQVGRLSAKPERDVLMQDFAEVETVIFPR